MKPWMMAGSTALALLYMTGAVQAAVTPEDVWANWKQMSESTGQKITAASEAREGDVLVVKGLTMAMDQDGNKASGTIEELRFADQGDGTVKVTMSDTMAMTSTTAGAEGEPAVQMSMTWSAPGMVMVASGVPEAIDYALDAPEIKLHVEGSDPVPGAESMVMMDMALTGSTGTFASAKADAGQKMDYQIASKSASITANVQDAADGTNVDVKLSVADVAGTFSGLLLGAEAMEDMAAALKAGFALDSNVTYGAGTYEINSSAADAPGKVSGAIGSGNFGFALSAAGLKIASGSKDVTLAVDSPAVPVPDMGGSYAEAAFALAMPMLKSDAPTDFILLTKLVDLKISDTLWSMIDAGNVLPHDPATLIIDTQGTATLTTDLADQAMMDALGDAPPGTIDSFALNQLNLKIAGAEVKGEGSLTFDNSAGPGAMPIPTGTIDLAATGVNTLIDKLVSMGLVPQDQAMQGKMMLGMFAAPGEGEDSLVSAIEFKGGSMTINGMEIPLQ